MGGEVVTRRKRGRPDAGCYAFRTRKPGAFWGWPLIGRHFAYVGQSGSRKRREGEHLRGSVHFKAQPKDWADLEPRFYRLPTLGGRYQVMRLIQEWLYSALLLPVYGTRPRIPWNLRKVTTKRAQWQRWAREELGLWYKIPRAAFRWSAVAAVVVLSAWLTPGPYWGGHL